jgi:hypothetical protein
MDRNTATRALRDYYKGTLPASELKDTVKSVIGDTVREQYSKQTGRNIAPEQLESQLNQLEGSGPQRVAQTRERGLPDPNKARSAKGWLKDKTVGRTQRGQLERMAPVPESGDLKSQIRKDIGGISKRLAEGRATTARTAPRTSLGSKGRTGAYGVLALGPMVRQLYKGLTGPGNE